MYQPTPLFSENGGRNIDNDIIRFEKVTYWLDPTLLISEDPVIHIVRKQISLAQTIENTRSLGSIHGLASLIYKYQTEPTTHKLTNTTLRALNLKVPPLVSSLIFYMHLT
ncbi:MAG: hypothetical protein ACI8O8_000964 [Oleiphilaceae bacterium]|jgi:hypothetical protein